jgi:hypothetical protein
MLLDTGQSHVGIAPMWHGLPAHESSAGCRCHEVHGQDARATSVANVHMRLPWYREDPRGPPVAVRPQRVHPPAVVAQGGRADRHPPAGPYPPHGDLDALDPHDLRGKKIDFWNLGDGSGTVRFSKYLSTTSGPVFGGFQAEQDHVGLRTSKGEQTILKEVWDVRVYNVGGPEQGLLAGGFPVHAAMRGGGAADPE